MNGSKNVSSYASGLASIIVVEPSTIKTPPRTTSLQCKYLASFQSSLAISKYDEEFEDIDLSADDNSSTSSTNSSLSCENEQNQNISPIITAAIQLSKMRKKRLSSLLSGKASIVYNTPQASESKRKRLSPRFFSWSNQSDGKINPSKKPTYNPPPQYDDGKAELIFRGIRVKEIPNTLDPIMLLPFDSMQKQSSMAHTMYY